MASTTTDNLVLQYITKGESAFRSSLSSTGAYVGALEDKMSKLGLAANAAGALGGYKVVEFIKNMGTASLEASGNIQQSEKAFGRLLGSSKAGIDQIQKSLEFARNTPFDLQQVIHGEQQLKAMGFSAKELIPEMKSLGDLVSSVGGDDATFSRLTYRLGEIRAQGKLYARDLMDLGRNGINVREIMKAATGKDMTRDQMTQMDGEQFVADFTKGVNIKFGGMMDEMMKTLPGQIHKLDNSFLNLKIDIGKALTPDASKLIADLTTITDKVDYFVKHHPRMTEAGLAGAGAVGLGVTGLFVGGTLAGAYKNITEVIDKATNAKKGLTAATKLDTAAEAAKAIVAGKEGQAIGAVGDVVEDVAGSKLGLAGATEKAAGKMEMLIAKSKGFWNKPLFAEAEAEAAASPYEFLGMGRYRDIASGKFVARDAVKDAGYLETVSSGASEGSRGLSTIEAFGSGGGALTAGNVVGGVGTGIMVGTNAYQDWKKAGYTTGQAAAASTVTGVAAGLLTTFAPGSKVPILIGEGIRWSINKAYNEPMEKRAEEGSFTGEEQAATKGMTPEQKRDYFAKKSAKELVGSYTGWHLPWTRAKMRDDAYGDEALSYGQSGVMLHNARKKAEADSAAALAAFDARNKQKEIMDRINHPASFYQPPKASQTRNGVWHIEIPQGAAGDSHRAMKYRINQPSRSPHYL